MTQTYVEVGLLLGALLFGGVTVYGFVTGKMLADYELARRDEDREWFWTWATINAGVAIACTLGFLLMLALRFFGNP